MSTISLDYKLKNVQLDDKKIVRKNKEINKKKEKKKELDETN